MSYILSALLQCRFYLLGVLLIGCTAAYSQCPTTVSCIPGNSPLANQIFGMGIYRVQLAALDTVTNGGADGYQDYSCRSGAVLQRGVSYTLTVHTNPGADETARAWLDFNSDGTFSVGEQILASTNTRRHSISFVLPANAPLGVRMRLRIAADYVTAPVPTACSTPQYSQTEDYYVLVAAGGVSPVPGFTATERISCTGLVAFRDTSRNLPTTWQWTFGDGATSTSQHPTHQYAAPGTYTVRLRVCNSTGCDSVLRTGYIIVRTDGPRPAACQPATMAYCCDFGITRVRLAGLDHRSLDGRAGYEDFSCAQRILLTADQPYVLQLTTGGTTPHNVRVYLDLNDDGQFTTPAERVYEGLAVQNPVVPLTLPAAAALLYNRPLRLRIWADAASSTPAGPCNSPQFGQVEDYTVTLLPNGAPPAAGFTIQYQQVCGPTRVAVVNTTSGGATSYQWRFGDGTAATGATPPVHTYAAAGFYDIQLIAQNAFGRDTVTHTVGVATACPVYCTAAGRGGTSSSPAYFTRVQLGSIDNALPRGPGIGYHDFTGQQTLLQQGTTATLQTESPIWTFAGPGPWTKVAAWIDYNQDGQFGPSEMATPVVAFSPQLLSIRVPANAKPGATRLRVIIQSAVQEFHNDSCTPSVRNATTEDYTVLIIPQGQMPTAGFQADLTTMCNGMVQLRDTSWHAPTSWLWNFGDGTTSTQQHPQHTYAAVGIYPVSLAASNRYGSHQITRTGYLTVTSLSTGPLPAGCVPVSGSPDRSRSLGSITIGPAWTYTAPIGAPGYLDETCATPVLRLSRGTHTVTTDGIRLPSMNPHAYYNVYQWLDLNEDGLFDQSTELVCTMGPFGTTQTGTLTIPATAPLNRPLRLRLQYLARSAPPPAVLPVPSPCYRSEQEGQVRDFTVVVTAVTSSASASTLAEVTLYPNPTEGTVTVSGLSMREVQVDVINMLGQQVATHHLQPSLNGQVQFQVSELPSGAYTVLLNGRKCLPTLLVR